MVNNIALYEWVATLTGFYILLKTSLIFIVNIAIFFFFCDTASVLFDSGLQGVPEPASSLFPVSIICIAFNFVH